MPRGNTRHTVCLVSYVAYFLLLCIHTPSAHLNGNNFIMKAFIVQDSANDVMARNVNFHKIMMSVPDDQISLSQKKKKLINKGAGFAFCFLQQ